MRFQTKRWVVASLIMLVTLWLCFVSYVGWAMRQTPEVFGRVMSRMPTPAYLLFPFETMWTQARAGRLAVGDPAPDLQVAPLSGETAVTLSSLWSQRPVVLIFGSYT